MRNVVKILIFTLISLLSFACNREPLKVNVDDIDVTVSAQRFEKDLFQIDYKSDLERPRVLYQKYGEFYNLFVHKMLNIPEGSDSVVADNLSKFVSDSEVRDI
ncbi:MAG TPA: hypothetical protein PKD91_15510, partial [Bacteroidia bacterium]|nr:hypothetical protein [Bacteroidia bacterium]